MGTTNDPVAGNLGIGILQNNTGIALKPKEEKPEAPLVSSLSQDDLQERVGNPKENGEVQPRSDGNGQGYQIEHPNGSITTFSEDTTVDEDGNFDGKSATTPSAAGSSERYPSTFKGIQNFQSGDFDGVKEGAETSATGNVTKLKFDGKSSTNANGEEEFVGTATKNFSDGSSSSFEGTQINGHMREGTYTGKDTKGTTISTQEY